VRELGERFQAVLADAARGDSAAFAELWRATHPPLLRYLRVIAGDAAEDAASETWLKVMRSLPSFVGDEQAFRGWLSVIARNVVRDLGRYAARRPETLQADPEPARHTTAPDAADQALERLGTERALRLLATLPPAQAELVALRVIVGLEPAEIGLIVGRNAGTVRVTVHRALATLARTLAGANEVVDVTTTAEEAFTREHG
jgi:RNA polymerase sigma-70 factor (ECF subfamily)